ncbi:MAG: carboxypeptidase regulatory-like domain-containing protein, partial [Terriglobia bacterium]
MRSSRAALFSLVLSFIFLPSFTLRGEDRPATAGLTLPGRVLDEAGRPLAQVSVEILDVHGTVAAEVHTTPAGRFSVTGLSQGTYWLQAHRPNQLSPRVMVGVAHESLEEVVLQFGQPLVPAIDAAPDRLSQPHPGAVQALSKEIETLKTRLAELQQQINQLAAAGSHTGGLGGETTEVGPELPEPAAEGLRQAPAQEPAGKEQEQEEKIPGRGRTDKGLYQGLAAGPPEARYGRSLFGDKVKIGGYASFRFEANNIDLGPQVGGLPRVKRGFDSFDFRRFVMTLDATPTDRLRVYTEIEYERLNEIEVERTAIPENRGRRNRAGTRFIQEVEGQSGGEIAVEQAWAQYDFTDWLGLRMGVILPPVGRFNILHDDDYWDIPRRTLVDRGGPVLPIKSAWRELGAGLLGNVPLGRGYLDYQFYVVNGAQLDFTLEEVVSLRDGRNLVELEPEIAFASGPFNGTNGADAVTWRVALSPRLGHEIALSGYHGQYTPDYLNIDSSINSVGVDGKTTLGHFEVEGEFVYTDFGQLEAVLGEMARQLVDAGAETSSSETATLETEVEAEFAGPLTNQRYGFWIDFKYRFWPRFLDESFLGRGFENPQLVPIVRFERIWFNDLVTAFDFAGGAITELQQENLQQQRTTLGLTYRP